MLLGIVFSSVLALGIAEKNEKQWVWSKNQRNQEGRNYAPNRFNSGYEVNEEEYSPEGTGYYPNEAPHYENYKPDFIPNQQQRPSGLYTSINKPDYYGQEGVQNNYPEESNPGILTGPVPSWVPQGPLKNFDKCKCTEKFNCPSPGISYGHCDVGKQYCCHATQKDGIIGSPFPSKVVHSPENGVLVGPGGPVDPIPASYPRPPLHHNSVNAFVRPGNGYGIRGERVNNGYGLKRGPEQNVYTPELGILVGPGGPHDRPGYGRHG